MFLELLILSLGVIFLIIQGYICYICPVQWFTGLAVYLILYILTKHYKENRQCLPQQD